MSQNLIQKQKWEDMSDDEQENKNSEPKVKKQKWEDMSDDDDSDHENSDDKDEKKNQNNSQENQNNSLLRDQSNSQQHIPNLQSIYGKNKNKKYGSQKDVVKKEKKFKFYIIQSINEQDEGPYFVQLFNLHPEFQENQILDFYKNISIKQIIQNKNFNQICDLKFESKEEAIKCVQIGTGKINGQFFSIRQSHRNLKHQNHNNENKGEFKKQPYINESNEQGKEQQMRKQKRNQENQEITEQSGPFKVYIYQNQGFFNKKLNIQSEPQNVHQIKKLSNEFENDIKQPKEIQINHLAEPQKQQNSESKLGKAYQNQKQIIDNKRNNNPNYNGKNENFDYINDYDRQQQKPIQQYKIVQRNQPIVKNNEPYVQNQQEPKKTQNDQKQIKKKETKGYKNIYNFLDVDNDNDCMDSPSKI